MVRNVHVVAFALFFAEETSVSAAFTGADVFLCFRVSSPPEGLKSQMPCCAWIAAMRWYSRGLASGAQVRNKKNH